MVQKYNKTTAFCLVLLVASSEIVHVAKAVNLREDKSQDVQDLAFVEMTVEQQLEVAESDWNIVKDAFTFISLQESDPGQSFTAEKEDARKTLKIPPLTGSNKFGSSRNKRIERNDSPLSKKLCHCMVDELLFGMTKGVMPYKPNHGTGRNKCFEFDAGWHATPLWYRRTNRKWYWTAHEPDNAPMDMEYWSRSSTFEVQSGFWRFLQKIGVSDVAMQNKFMIKLIEDFNPTPKSHPPKGSDYTKMDAKYDQELCLKRGAVKPGSDMCAFHRSGCMKNIVTRYFQYADMQLVQAKRDNKVRLLLDLTSFALDIAGMVEPFGFVFDLINAGLSWARQHWIEAILSLLSAIPGFGSMFVPIKWNAKVMKQLKFGAKTLIAAIKIGPFFARLAKNAKRGYQATKAWFQALFSAIKYVSKFVKKAFVLRKGWFKLIERTKSIMKTATRAMGSAKLKAKAKIFAVDAVNLIKKHFDNAADGSILNGICKAMKILNGATKSFIQPISILEMVGKFLEFTGGPFYIKETGEWIQAFVPCLKLRCGGDITDAYNCGLHMGFETFKKISPPEVLDLVGEYDPCMFSKEQCDFMSLSLAERNKFNNAPPVTKKVQHGLTADEACMAHLPFSFDPEHNKDDDLLDSVPGIYGSINPYVPFHKRLQKLNDHIPYYIKRRTEEDTANKLEGVPCNLGLKGVCIDTRKQVCDRETYTGVCPGSAHIKCCPDIVPATRKDLVEKETGIKSLCEPKCPDANTLYRCFGRKWKYYRTRIVEMSGLSNTGSVEDNSNLLAYWKSPQCNGSLLKNPSSTKTLIANQ
jgi:hypothetical protein